MLTLSAGQRLAVHALLLALAIPSLLPFVWMVSTSLKPDSQIYLTGDSLSAEYGLPRGTGWVALLEQRLAHEHIAAHVVNASISGDTTAGGRARLPALLKAHGPQVVVLELGGNDALRGLSLAATQANLAEMAREAKAAGARVLIVGMQMPPNYGRQYGEEFVALFAKVAKVFPALVDDVIA